jgi:drug/metabolite transporter (DMT)-like permease
MTQVTRQRSAAIALAVTGLIHLAITPEGLDAQTYVGVLFLLGGVTCLTAAVLLWRGDDRRVWTVAALVCAGMFAAFILSRTVGLPGFKEEEWEPIGLVSLVAEAWVVVAALVSPRVPVARRPAAGRRVATGIRD